MPKLITTATPAAIQTSDKVVCMQILQTIFSAIKSEHT